MASEDHDRPPSDGPQAINPRQATMTRLTWIDARYPSRHQDGRCRALHATTARLVATDTPEARRRSDCSRCSEGAELVSYDEHWQGESVTAFRG